MSRDRKNIDGGWAWVVLGASFMCNVIVDGVCLTFGIFFLEFLDYFKESKSKTAWVGSVLNGTYMIMGPITAALAKQFGCRMVTIIGAVWASVAFIVCRWSPNVNTLILTCGILGGMGFGLLYLPSIVVVGYYFDKRRALATGITTCGSGIGGFIFAPLCKFLIQKYAWQGAMLIIAGIILNCIICGSLFRPIKTPEELNQVATETSNDDDRTINTPKIANQSDSCQAPLTTNSGSSRVISNESVTARGTQKSHLKVISVCKEVFQGIQESMDMRLLQDPVFVIYGISCILCMAGFFVPFVYLADNAIGIGIESHLAAFLISILGITNTVGRVLVGWVSDQSWADCLLINNCALLIGGIATMLCPFCNNYALLCIYATVFGLCIAAFVSLRPIILVDLIGLDRLTSAFGLIVLCQGISTFVGAPFAGFLYDVTGSFDASFYVGGATIAVSGLICFPLRILSKHLKKKRQNYDRAKQEEEIEHAPSA